MPYPNTVTLHSPLDMHLHLRDGQMLHDTVKASAKTFSGAIIMPNLVPPLTSEEALVSYKMRIQEAMGDETFIPYMTLFFKSTYSRTFLESIRNKMTAIKLYPAGITTNSEGGVSGFDLEDLRETLEAMSDLHIPLCVHGETNGFVMDREAEFIPIYEKLAKAFPKLKIIMEHITTAESVAALDRFDNLYATITVHHLLITLDDVAGGMLQPHLFCKPIAKRPEDKEALLRAALTAHPKVMFGSDSAPHPKEDKESCGCAAGVFTAPIAIQLLIELFEKHDAPLENLQKFLSDHAKSIYGITPPTKAILLEKKPFKVPSNYGSIVPMSAEEMLQYTITEVKHG
ncbi:MAG: dihydroorotase [Sulfurovum sp.]|nr:dihydroorotase [Sulfurovum sp.]MCB4744551.1 dihydroorotase [Sulfurovum sp.]MCB4746259.1 dihydroorotase [Sulfurovum sp.]MCB4747057.1 dihydroorotase [Sulfurovum sp.]MCB4749347.1 dihydroorotase [Sulfurovum sp.]